MFATVLAGRPARVILSLALTVFTLPNALSAVPTSLTMLLIARAVAGIGAGVYSPLAAATAASLSSSLVALVLHLALVRWGRERPVSARRAAPLAEAKADVSA